ncbi:hypothetical protein [Fodinicurvata fenggangensis]|uniref:hypothetical protein n=1 Tax=Fodinicurvata fenggangensis TaxID=1121830 RepID=UPI00047BF5C2|nr:hypothetical protein [Fodinicurvata fenggangensis]
MKHAVTAIILAGLQALPAWAQDDAPPAEAVIKERCEAEWPDDFSMQKFCRDEEEKAVADLRDFRERHEFGPAEEMERRYEERDPAAVMWRGCAQQWTDSIGMDFGMVAFCLEEQEKSWEALQ